MEKKNFVLLIMGAVGGILFRVGMCMCLLPEWNAFRQGILVSAVDAIVLLAMLSMRRKIEGEPAIQLDARAVGSVVLGIAGALALGNGVCLTMAWNMLVPGIVIRIAGVVLLLCSVPICEGLK